LRRYQDGDDVRAIDWPMTARQRSPYVRVYAEERDRAVLLLVDQRLSMFFGSRRAMKSVAAAEVAGLAAWRVERAGDRIGAVIFDDSACVVVRPARGQAAVQRVLSEIARLNGNLRADAVASDPAALNRALAQVARLATHDWLVVMISDAAGADAVTTWLVSTIAVHNDVFAIFVFDRWKLPCRPSAPWSSRKGRLGLRSIQAPRPCEMASRRTSRLAEPRWPISGGIGRFR
jgi:uncharacterized protein (DUF58 family)